MSTDSRVTPGPWKVDPKHPLCIESGEGNIGLVNLARASEADARLIAAAPDHALLAAAICAGRARWEPFSSQPGLQITYGGEVCINGLRHATTLDQFGVPILTAHLRAALLKELSK